MGNTTDVVARLDVISVKKFTLAIIVIKTISSPISLSKLKWLPSHTANPESLNPFARAIPPPNNKSTPQGIFSASFQDINLSVLLFEGRRNKVKTAIKAMIESFIEGRKF